MLMRRKMRDYLAHWRLASPDPAERAIRRLEAEGLLTPEEAAKLLAGEVRPAHPPIEPSRWFYWNVHLDGLEASHDAIVEKPGVFRECLLAIRMAKALGFQVATNTTVYRETDMGEIERLFGVLAGLGVDGHTISPGYEYDAAKRDMAARLNLDPASFFLTREQTIAKFRRAPDLGRRFPIFGTPVYLEFLAGLRDLTCSAWAIPTRNIRGWKGPCYLITDGHYATYRDLLERTDWSALGVSGGVARDPRCEHCMVHCGYEPSASLGIGARPGDTLKTIAFNFGPRPKPTPLPVPPPPPPKACAGSPRAEAGKP
jgi:hypothetical protein